jgi:hypothetical protein
METVCLMYGIDCAGEAGDGNLSRLNRTVSLCRQEGFAKMSDEAGGGGQKQGFLQQRLAIGPT